MEYYNENKQRIIQELVPGKQITLAHVIANPDKILYKKLGLDPAVDYAHSAIGIITMSPAETAIIAADIATKVTGTVSEVNAAMKAVNDYCLEKLHFSVCEITKT